MASTSPAVTHQPAAAPPQPPDPAGAYQRERVAHWDGFARTIRRWRKESYYHRRLAEVYRFLIPPGQKVLEIGSGRGNLLAALEPSVGVGIDFSEEMVERAAKEHPQLTFIQADAHALELEGPFDTIILSDLVNDLWDIQTVLEQCRRLSTPGTRLIINTYSRIWEAPLSAAEKLRVAQPNLGRNWVTPADLRNLLYLADFEVIRGWLEILWPFRTPLVDTFINRFLVRLWPFSELALANFMVARPAGAPAEQEPSVSVIIPARNEAGNIESVFTRTPRMGRKTELVFVEGHSKDDTRATIEKAIAAHPDWPCQLAVQTGVGKGDAVRLGFSLAQGDILMILDADLTMPPEDLPRFYEAIRSGKGEFINGVRLVYPMEGQAMRPLNLLGNKFFSYAFSWLLGQTIRDTLCGTKVLWKADYDWIAANRGYFGDFDPFGDFDLLLGAARRNLRITEMPIRYRERTYGSTNIQRWKHGWLLLQMVVFAARKLKFV